MIIRTSIKKADGVIVEGQVDNSSEFANFENYVKEFFSNSPNVLESSIIYAANEGKFYAKNSAGEWTSGEETDSTNSVSNVSSLNSITGDNSLRTSLLSDNNKSALFPDETEVQSDDELLGRSESE